jgi:hypothetical protein
MQSTVYYVIVKIMRAYICNYLECACGMFYQRIAHWFHLWVPVQAIEKIPDFLWRMKCQRDKVKCHLEQMIEHHVFWVITQGDPKNRSTFFSLFCINADCESYQTGADQGSTRSVCPFVKNLWNWVNFNVIKCLSPSFILKSCLKSWTSRSAVAVNLHVFCFEKGEGTPSLCLY